MAHAFAAERIQHACGIAYRNVVSRQRIISERARYPDDAIRPVEVLRQFVLINEEAVIRSATLDRDGASITTIEEPKIQHVTPRFRIGILNPEFMRGFSTREAAQLPCGVHKNGALRLKICSVNSKSLIGPAYSGYRAFLPNLSPPSYDLVQAAA